MISRAIVLLSSILVILVSADTLRHESFDSGVVGTQSLPKYFVRCEELEFGSEATTATVRVIDGNPFPQFQAYRQASRGHAPALYVPAAYGSAGGWLRFVHFEEIPDLILNPKPDNDIHEAVLKIAFEPIEKLRSDPLGVDKVYLYFPGFRPFEVRRTVPVSQAQNMLVSVDNSVMGTLSQSTAVVLLSVGLVAFGGIAADTYRQHKVLVYAWKVKQLHGKGARMHGGKSSGEVGEVLAPPKWDETLIATQFRNLAHRPAMLGVFVNAVRDRFILHQDEKVASKRIRYLRTKLEELKVSKELQSEIDDLAFRETNLDIRRMEQELKVGDLAFQVKTRAAIREAEHKRDLLRVKVEEAQLKKQMHDTKTAAAPPSNDVNQRHVLRERIQRAREELAYARETTTDPDERRRKENLYADRIAQLEEDLSSLA